MAHTFVAVATDGLDPCDLRLAHGDAAVRALVEDKVPLFEFAIKQTIATYDLNTAEGRVAALREAAPIIATIRDSALRPEYARRLAGWLGMDASEVTRALARPGSAPNRATVPLAPNDRTLTIERQALKCALQFPAQVHEWYGAVEATAFTHPRAIAVHAAITAAGGPDSERDGLVWIDAVLDACPDDEVRGLVRELAVDPIPADETTIDRYATGIIARLLERDASRRIDDLRGRMQRSDDDAAQSQELLVEIVALEDHRRSLLRQALGES
jgi:DNA primase